MSKRTKVPKKIRYELRGGHIEFIPSDQLTCILVNAPPPTTEKIKINYYSVEIDPEMILDIADQIRHYTLLNQQ